MDLYILDNNWLKTATIDMFNSLVWTERYNDSGECVLTLPASTANRALITEGIFLYTPVSREVMLIDTISIEDGVLTASGRSLVDFLKQRMFRNTWSGAKDGWNLTAAPIAANLNAIVNLMIATNGYMTDGTVLTNAQGSVEAIPNVTIAPAPTSPSIPIVVPYGPLFDAVKMMADLDSLGFTLYPTDIQAGNGGMTFLTYRGLDRTTSQSTNGQVIFDPAFDSLVNIKELRSTSGYKNVCWVWPMNLSGQTQVGVAYAPGAQFLTTWQRRTMMLIASDVNVADYTAANLALVLNQKGRDALANNNYVRMVDGTVVPQNAFVYGTDYNLGDVIELRGTTSVSQSARVTEYIRSQDSNGELAYPTLSVI